MSQWIEVAERLPEEGDWDVDGQVWVIDAGAPRAVKQLMHRCRADCIDQFTHWMPTGVKASVPARRYSTVAYARGKVRLGELDDGELFLYDGILAMKTKSVGEYNEPLAYVYGTGEKFYPPGVSRDKLRALNVQHVALR